MLSVVSIVMYVMNCNNNKNKKLQKNVKNKSSTCTCRLMHSFIPFIWKFLFSKVSKWELNCYNLALTCLNSLLKTTSSAHSHSLRNSTYNLFVPRPSTEAGKQSFQYCGSILWNRLPFSTKIQPTISSFKPCNTDK